MRVAILDCYTDEPSGLGVPPYLGVYPRYVAGAILKNRHECFYLRIDDLRTPSGNIQKSDVLTINQTRNAPSARQILAGSDVIVVIAGIHTPGRYLSAIPGTTKEAARLLSGFYAKKILVGPEAGMGSMQFGGRLAKRTDEHLFDYIIEGEPASAIHAFLNNRPGRKLSYKELQGFSEKGAAIVSQINLPIMAELETGRGCPRGKGCSFCTEPLKNALEWREQAGVIREAKALASQGVQNFRLGKQSDFFSYKGGAASEIEALLKPLSAMGPKTLHIDNVDPVVAYSKEGIIKLIVKYCTAGNVAPLGVESFDPKVIKANNLGATPKIVVEVTRKLNRLGGMRGGNGMPVFLPGINILLGLIGENKETLEINLRELLEIKKAGLLLRRINIRQVDVFPGTMLAEVAGLKYLKKNKRHYFSFRRKVRELVDHEMLKGITPVGTILKDVFMEIYDGNHTFGRQLGSYPLIVGVNERLKLREFYDIQITGHMLRSITGVPVSQTGSQAY